METVIALDLETTGFNIKKADVLEIGAVRLQVGTGKTDTLQQLVTCKDIPKHITELTGISAEVLEAGNAIPVAEALGMLEELITVSGRNTLLVGHNILRYDLPLLEYRYGGFWQGLAKRFRVWDTLAVERELNKRRGAKNAKLALSNLLDRYKIKVYENHRALPDAQAAITIYQKQQRKKFSRFLK